MRFSRIITAAAFLAVAFSINLVQAQLRPLSPQDKARVDELLKSFDPNSYDFHYQHTDASGKVESAHAGLANLTQSNTVKIAPGSAASTNTIINIFKQASTNTTINIFKEASTNTVINIFKDARQQAAAQELNGILQKYSGPAAPTKLVPAVEPAGAQKVRESAAKPVVVEGGIKPGATAPEMRKAGGEQGVVIQGGMKPLSAQDKARVDELLRSFDPNSYDFHYQHLDASGKVQSAHAGLANLTQSNTVKIAPGSAASTNTIINIFKQASTNTTINIFKEASTNTVINIFKDAHQQAAAEQLNAILRRYVQ